MAFEIVLMPAMLLIGPHLTTMFQNQGNVIPPFWQRFHEEQMYLKIPNQATPGVVLGLYTNYSPDFSTNSGTYDLIAGCPVSTGSNIPAGMVAKEIPAGKYAVFTARGPFYPAIFNVWMEVWQTPGLERTFANDFEWYGPESTGDENSMVKVYIGIK
ncbi:GyrI-like domain-containing protein [Candidatus Dependentiae bacterium]|nr:GyrI-like domain-containing protein [Candidatus Dependentiae bacterium]